MFLFLFSFQRLYMFVSPSASIQLTISLKKVIARLRYMCFSAFVVVITSFLSLGPVLGIFSAPVPCLPPADFSGSCWDLANQVKMHVNLILSFQTRPIKSPKRIVIAIFLLLKCKFITIFSMLTDMYQIFQMIICSETLTFSW